MKPLTCEMCGSTEIIRKDGMYVCQACGTKYSIEDAKKMMMEGTVKIDSSDSISHLLNLAKTAYDGLNMEEALNYSNKVLELDSSNVEAWRIKMHATSYIANHFDYKVNEVLTAAKKVLDLSNDIYKEEVYEKVIITFGNGIVCAIDELLDTNIVSSLYENNLAIYGDPEEAAQKTRESDMVMESTRFKIDQLWPLREFVPDSEVEHSEKLQAALKESANNFIAFVDAQQERAALYNSIFMPKYYDIVNEELAKIQSGLPINDKKKISKPQSTNISNTAQTPYNNQSNNHGVNQSNSSGGCYIATSYYGSYDCPEVWILRRYRDNTLHKSWIGRQFITLYYAISPTLVKWFGQSKIFKKVCKYPLEHIVTTLYKKGVKNTPYQDQNF